MIAEITTLHQSGLGVKVEGKPGFVPRRELSWDDRYLNPSENFRIGQPINVVDVGVSQSGLRLFSLKRAEHDPWKIHAPTLVERINKGRYPIKRGTVEEVRPSVVYVLLEDRNEAVLYPDRAFGSEDRRKDSDLTSIFSIGDHVKGKLIRTLWESKKFVLDIKGYVSGMEEAFASEDRRPEPWPPVWENSVLRGLAQKLYHSQTTSPDADAMARLNVLGVEDDPDDREELRTVLRDLNCSYSLPESLMDFQACLKEAGQFDVVILDKNLDMWESGRKSSELLDSIREHYKDIPVAVFSADGPDITQEVFSQWPNVDIFGKPYSPYIVEIALKRMTGLLPAAVFRNMRHTDRCTVGSSVANGSAEDRLRDNLRSLCEKSPEGLGAAILRMDSLGREVHPVCTHGLPAIRWSMFKSLLRHTPISDVIQYGESFFHKRLPESRKRHFPQELEFASFAGVPIETFEETNHGLFLFGRTSESVGNEICALAHSQAPVIARILERLTLERLLADEAVFAFHGRLYMAMGHEIRDAVNQLIRIPDNMRNHLSHLKSPQPGIDRGNLFSKMTNCIDDLEKADQRIRGLFSLYTDLRRERVDIWPFDVENLVKSVVEEMKTGYRDTSFGIHVQGSVTVVNSKIKCRQILRNLVINACQQMREHQTRFRRVYVHVSLDKTALLPVKIKVEDTGPGIPRKDWETIFEPFLSTRREGAGLGLYLCRVLARSMGGSIRVQESFRLVGTTFLLELPEKWGKDND